MQSCVEVMRELTNSLRQSGDAQTLEQLSTIVGDSANLQQSLAALNPGNYMLFQSANLEGQLPERPTDDHWVKVLVGFSTQAIVSCPLEFLE